MNSLLFPTGMGIHDLVYQEDPTVIGAYAVCSRQDGDWRLRAAHRDQEAAYAHVACLTNLGLVSRVQWEPSTLCLTMQMSAKLG
jgi:hypothetical protein